MQKHLKTIFSTKWKKRNCSWSGIFPFATMFSSVFNDYTFLYRDFAPCSIYVFKVFWCKIVACGKGLTLSHIQQINSRQLWKHTRHFLETPFKWKYNNWIELKTWWQKEKFLVSSNFFICLHVFKKPSHDLLQRRQKASIWGKSLVLIWLLYPKLWVLRRRISLTQFYQISTK